MNFAGDPLNPGFAMCKLAFDRLSVVKCDDLFVDANPLTYVSEHLHCSSFIDHCCVSDGLKPTISSVHFIESDANLSDHRPIVVNCLVTNSVSEAPAPRRDKASRKKVSAWRWDKSDLGAYYAASNLLVSPLLPTANQLCCVQDCTDPSSKDLIDNTYTHLASALQSASLQTVAKVPVNSLKPFWNDELDRLKHEATIWHDIWLAADKPLSGSLHHIKCSTILKYKLGLR